MDYFRFGFVTFTDKKMVDVVLSLKNVSFDGKTIEIK